MINNKRLIQTFIALVKIKSVSLQERAVAAFLERELKKLGYKPRQTGRPKEGEVGNLVVDIPGRGRSGPRVLLNAHIDTVNHQQPIRPVVKKGFIVSDGMTILGADNKAGVAAILEILRTFREKKLDHPPLRVIFTVAEEIGLVGAKSLLGSLLHVDCGLVLDGGDIDEIIHQAPAQKNLTATIFGKAAHAGIHPEEGISAIRAASEAVNKMKLGRIDHETTANIGVIKGGEATNIIPDRVELKGEARSHDPNKLWRQIGSMKKVLEETCRKHRARLVLQIRDVYSSFEVPRSSRLLHAAARAIKKAGLEPEIKQTGGGSDANIFNAAGVPTIILGVGADRVHTERERIRISEFIRGTEIVLDMLVNLK